MSDREGVLQTWGLLSDVYPAFLSPVALTAGDGAETHIGFLRDELEGARKKQQSFSLSKWTDRLPSIQDLRSSLDNLAGRLEAHVDRQIESYSDPTTLLSQYTRLNLLRQVLLDTTPPGNDTSDRFQHTDSQHSHEAASMSTSSTSTTSTSATEAHIEHAARFIQFPRDVPGIQSLRSAVATFSDCLDNEVFRWDHHSAPSTERDLARIQRAHQCSSLYTSLFLHLAGNGTCNAQHQAKLDLSSVEKGKMKIIFHKCQEKTIERGLPAVFTHSHKKPTSNISTVDDICASTANAEYLRAFFNMYTMWSLNEDNASGPLTITPRAERLLEDFLGKKDIEDTLAPKRRSLAMLFLATALFNLIGSPWLKEPIETHDISVDDPHSQPLHQWRVHASRSLVRDAGAGNLAESVSAFGLLFIELETGFKMDWADADEIKDTGKRLHRRRLRRLTSMPNWNERIHDDVQEIALSCLDFKRLVNSLPEGDMTEDMESQAIIYHHVLMPIFRHNRQLLKELEKLSPASFAPPSSLPQFHSTVVPADPIAEWKLFDTEDVPPSLSQVQLTRCKQFFSEAEQFFECIRAIRKKFPKHKKRVKIVLLDSGLDTEETMIAEAIGEGRINVDESKSFVKSAWSQANDMHGTNVAELLIRSAPTAEIVIGKICEHRDGTDDMLPPLAKAIQWAVEEQKADVLCLALGYRIPHQDVESALSHAIRENVLVVAAASNEGGLAGRARPACLEGIIAMHASDGKGNLGGMNPTRVEHEKNFMTLGDGVDVLWKGKELVKSGTSFAVPIAAGFIACILDFVAGKMPDLPEPYAGSLKRKTGMEAVLVKMSKTRLVGGHHFFINPKHLCRNWKKEDEVQKAVKRVRKALQAA